MALVCVGVLIYCLLAHRWPAVAALALAGAIFCAISPHMTGRFGLSGSGIEIGGQFVDPGDENGGNG